MNKLLLVENINKIAGGEHVLECVKSPLLVITKNTILHYYESKKIDLKLIMEESSNLVFNSFYNLKHDLKINISLKHKANLEYNILIINEGINKVIIEVLMEGNYSKCQINAKVINKNRSSKVDVIINGKIKNDTLDNEFVENIKGLILSDDYIKISPNIDVLTSDVTANHLVTIGSFNKEEIFYLRSKGITEDNAKYMIMKGFITSILSKPLTKYLDMEVINFE